MSVTPANPASHNDEAVPPLLRASTLWELLCKRVAATPDAPMLLDANGVRLTFREFGTAVETLAAGLYERGIGSGTMVAWQLPTRISSAVLMVALARLGAIQNPIIHLYREREVAAVLSQSRPAFFFLPENGDRDYAQFARAVTAGMERAPQVIAFDGVLNASRPVTLPSPPVAADDVRWTLYTSGTTSDPKGVRHTDGTISAAAHFLATQIGAKPTDVGTIAYPIAHIGGPLYLTMVLASGMSAVLLEGFDAPVARQIFRDLGVTLGGGSTVHYLAFLAEQRKQPDRPIIPTLRLISGGGAAMPAELYHQVRKEVKCVLTHAYGMTEAPIIAQGSFRHSDEQLANSEGSIMPGTQVKIARSDGSPAMPGEEGEVRLRGPSVCKGYTDPDLTAKAFDEEGFFRTGDLGLMRPDGHIRLTGRIKDVIIRKGENISAKEIEDLLFLHPKIAAAVVIGLPDAERGERVCAVVELRPDAKALQLSELVDYFKKAGLMRQKIPEQLEIVDRLPRSETFNKVLKHKLRARFSS
jgi:acyl-CoA synthetase (AMP-forming)/AMP-acid ligase II